VPVSGALESLFCEAVRIDSPLLSKTPLQPARTVASPQTLWRRLRRVEGTIVRFLACNVNYKILVVVQVAADRSVEGADANFDTGRC
jgi:hypothetical protein